MVVEFLQKNCKNGKLGNFGTGIEREMHQSGQRTKRFLLGYCFNLHCNKDTCRCTQNGLNLVFLPQSEGAESN